MHRNNLHLGHDSLAHPRPVRPSQEAMAVGSSSMSELFKMPPSPQAPPNPSLSPEREQSVQQEAGKGGVAPRPQSTVLQADMKAKSTCHTETWYKPFQPIRTQR